MVDLFPNGTDINDNEYTENGYDYQLLNAVYIENRCKDTYHYIYEEDDDYEMFYSHLLCNAINENINSIYHLV